MSDAACDEKRNKPHLPVVLEAVGSHPVVRAIGEDRADGTLDGLLGWFGRSSPGSPMAPSRTCSSISRELESPGLARAFYEAVRSEVPDPDPLSEPVGQTSMF